MKKAILISIRPEWVEKILNGEKTIEIRKSMPKCELPIDVYIYCSKPNKYPNTSNGNKTQILSFDKSTNKYRLWRSSYGKVLNGKVVAKFTLNKIEEIKLEFTDHPELGYGINENCGDDWYEWESDDLLEKCCLTYDELYEYGNHEDIYAWHIDNLQIFDKPMELNEFYRNNWLPIFETTSCDKYDCEFKVDNSILGDDGFCRKSQCPKLRVRKPPQSWQYVNVVE